MSAEVRQIRSHTLQKDWPGSLLTGRQQYFSGRRDSRRRGVQVTF